MSLPILNMLGLLPQTSAPNFLADEAQRYANQIKGTEARYAEPMTQQKLREYELENAFKSIRNKTAHEKNVADIGLTKAQTGLAGAHAGLYGAQTKGYNFENQINDAVLPYILKGLEGYKSGLNEQQSNSQLSALLADPVLGGLFRKKLGIESAQLGDMQKAIQDAKTVERLYGPDSAEAQLANSWLERKAHGNPGMQLSVGPNGEVTLTQGNAPKGTGPQLIDGKLVTPQTAQTTNQLQKAELANVSRDYLSEAADQPYKGSGSNGQLWNDWNEVKKNPDIDLNEPTAQRLIKAALADKLVPERAMEQLRSQGIEGTRFNLKAQEEALKQGWAEGLKLATNNLPPKLQNEVNRLHDEVLKESARLKKDVASTGFAHEVGKPAVPPAAKETAADRKIVEDVTHIANLLNPENPITPKDIEETARLYGKTPAEVAKDILDKLRKKQE